MTYEDLGYNSTLDQYRNEQGLNTLEVGRVISEHKERYIVKTPTHEFDAELIGNLRYTAESRYDFPAVGDWVAFMQYDESKALIHAIFPRRSIIERRAAGKASKVQIIATNVDFGLIVQAVDRDFNVNRLERYLTICNTAKVEPIIVLNKIDLINKPELSTILNTIKQRIKEVKIITVSNKPAGYSQLEELIEAGKTYCLLGSSGVGKSTIINALSGKEEMKTGEISSAVHKGKHTTSHRELISLPNGGIVIDNPGMREVGITDKSDGLEITFDAILEHSQNCKYQNCTHTHEKGCAVIEAVENGEIDQKSYTNFLKMIREKAHFEATALERKKKDKDLGKMIKQVKKQKKNHKH
ncbi:ribosome small subunit-dependent GTPase A [Fulvivirga sp. 29W222]|uniref:Small ribosomal subunit biogenesis GTPase RsgA n=1 Tax=Fulvivirga marina TaxID=2494733 RepID=A0A937G154_9BACT|nr:ribosome small subunit-dependent GTPase A [Fulvivirga marina]MBL6448266.1 ribosome small subunit-dependent GTPase A [Fulvivirga marina]